MEEIPGGVIIKKISGEMPGANFRRNSWMTLVKFPRDWMKSTKKSPNKSPEEFLDKISGSGYHNEIPEEFLDEIPGEIPAGNP